MTNSLDVFQTISIIVIILGGISGIVWTYLKGKKELKRQNVDINGAAIDNSKDALEIVILSTKQVLDLKREISDAEHRMKIDRETLMTAYNQQITDMQTEIADVKAQLTERDKRLEELQDWAERLVHQVQSLGGVPVPMKLKKTKEA